MTWEEYEYEQFRKQFHSMTERSKDETEEQRNNRIEYEARQKGIAEIRRMYPGYYDDPGGRSKW